jgi:hypothetical protein
MTTYTKRVLSGSTNGRGIKVAATSTPGTTIHAAVSGTTDFDEIWLYAFNSHGSDVMLTIEWGGTTDPNDIVEVTIPFRAGWVPVVPGFVLQNSLSVAAFASVADVITIQGWVNRIEA